MSEKIALIAIDWGTSNRRAWAFAGDGRIVDERADASGLLATPPGAFAQAFSEIVKPWRGEARPVPVIMCGMVGSKLGWIEAPYLHLPLDFDELSRGLRAVPGVEAVWIVPGVCDSHDAEPDVMRGEECQILGAILNRNVTDAILVLPGTHSKWAVVKGRRLARFRTYMTGELFNMLCVSGTIAQLMQPGDHDAEAFRKGVARGSANGSALLHTLFGVRTLGLFQQMKPQALASYLSGLLIGVEFADGLRWTTEGAPQDAIIGIGSARLLANYASAAGDYGKSIELIDSEAILPVALHALARQAGIAFT